ncbi:MAG: lysyl oxidase family protein [Candidatus Methylomirabilales bacterium]
MRLLSYAILILVSGCLDLEIVTPRNGDEFVAGERIEFGAQADDALKGKIRWIVDGTHMGTGESFATATLSVGWHEVVAELGEDDNALQDVVHVQVISWNAIPAPNMALVRAMVRDGVRKETWLAVPGEGVYKVDDLGGAHLFSASTGDLPSDEVRDLTFRGGEVWVGTSTGVARYAGSVWETYTRFDGLPSDDVRALSVDARDSRLWLATPAGLASWDGNAWQSTSYAVPATALTVRDGVAWVGTDGNGIHRFDGKSWDRLPGDAELEKDRIEHLVPTLIAPRRLWVAGAVEGLVKYYDGGWERFHQESLEPLVTVGIAVEEATRSLWIAEANTLTILRRSANGLWRRYDAQAAISGLEGPWHAITVDDVTGAKWLATDTHIVSLAASGLSREAIDLPDLVAHAPTGIKIKSWSKGPELVLETTIANQGDGVLEIEAHPDLNTDHKVATQNIYHGEWIVAQYPVGEFFFVEHEDHHHYHLNAFTIYQLREVLPGNGVGAILSQSLKVSWCLNDFLSVSLGAGEGQYTCSTNLQGISVGWADRYLSRQSGQSIAIAGIPSGEYWVVVMATSLFAEKDYQNNTAMTKIRFDAQGNVTVLEEIGPKGPPTREGVKQRG